MPFSRLTRLLFLTFFLLPLPRAEAALPWTGASPGPDGYTNVPWLGRVYDAGGGWVWHDSLGWLYAQGSAPSSVYFYKPGLGWLWCGSSSPNTFYSWDIGGWIYHAPGTSHPQWFFDYSASRWVADYMDGNAAEDVSSLLASIPGQYNVPAVACAMTVGGKIVAHGWAGVLEKNYSARVGPTSRWEIASCSKSVACLLAAELVESGQLRWTDTIASLAPDITENVGWTQATLFDLLHHTAGINNDAVYTYFNPYTAAGATRTLQRRSMMTAVLSHAPSYTPGSTYLYSGIGYTMAGYLVETKAGVPYETLVTREIFGRLGIRSGGFLLPAAAIADRDTQPWGHKDGVPVDPLLPQNELAPFMVPCGGLNMTVDDLARYAAAHAAGELGLCPVLSTQMWITLHRQGSTANTGYAFGWYGADAKYTAVLGLHAVCHTGNNGNFETLMIAAPDANVAVVGVCNEGNYSLAFPAVEEALRRMLVEMGYF